MPALAQVLSLRNLLQLQRRRRLPNEPFTMRPKLLRRQRTLSSKTRWLRIIFVVTYMSCQLQLPHQIFLVPMLHILRELVAILGRPIVLCKLRRSGGKLLPN